MIYLVAYAALTTFVKDDYPERGGDDTVEVLSNACHFDEGTGKLLDTLISFTLVTFDQLILVREVSFDFVCANSLQSC